MSETEDHNKRGRPLGRWKDRVKEYVHDRGATRRGGLYVSETESPNRRGRPLGRWKDRVTEYMHERSVCQ